MKVREFDMVVAAYVINEFEDDEMLEKTIRTLWSLTKDALVIIEPGTPNGFRNILLTRNIFFGNDFEILQKNKMANMIEESTNQTHFHFGTTQ